MSVSLSVLSACLSAHLSVCLSVQVCLVNVLTTIHACRPFLEITDLKVKLSRLNFRIPLPLLFFHHKVFLSIYLFNTLYRLYLLFPLNNFPSSSSLFPQFCLSLSISLSLSLSFLLSSAISCSISLFLTVSPS